MSARPLHIVDVFAERKYAGNQLAVVRNSGDLTTDQMQEIALEMNFSETTFLLSDAERDGGWDVRIFTPAEEVPFAGHPTLGTAWVIRNELLGGARDDVVLNLKVGKIPVRFDHSEAGDPVLWMRQREPEFGETADAASVAALLRLSEDDLDGRFPNQTVSTGIPFWIIPLRSLEAVKRARVHADRYEAWVREKVSKAIFVFAPEASEPGNQIHARMFADEFRVPEDPATGSANGCLAGYLVEHRFFGDDRVEARVEQGYEMDRPSLLRLRAERRGSSIEVNVGGRVVPVARGELV